MVALENGYIAVGVGIGGKWKIPPPNHFLMPGQGQPAGGRFHIWCTGGDPTTIQDDGQELNFSLVYPPGPGDKWGAFQLMVDSWTTEEANPQHLWAEFQRGGTSAVLGDMLDGGWETIPYIPTNEPNVIRGVWYPAQLGLANEVLLPGIRCEMEVKLMRDTVRFKWTFTNEDPVDHLVGMRVYADLLTNPVDDGTVDLRNIVSIPGHPLLLDRTVLSGNDVPAAVELFNSASDPVTSIRLTFDSQGATRPDKVGVDEWVYNSWREWTYWYGDPQKVRDPFMAWLYDEILPPNQYIDDLAYGAFWQPRRLPARQSMSIIHYIGLASATSDFTKPNLDRPQYVAAVQGPRTLKYYSDVMGIGRLYPQVFSINAYLLDTEKYVDLDNPSFTLALPPGLVLDDSEGGKYTKALPKVNALAEGAVSWKVRTVGNPTGILDYSVSFSASPIGGTSVRRQINIPATETQTFASGWQMISVPFTLTNPDPGSALGLSSYRFWRYDPHLRQYQPVYQLVPGEAYWLRISTPQTTQMTPGQYSPIAWAGTQGYQIPLQQGWNLVGNPFLYTVTLGEIRFYYRDYGSVDYEEAVERGLISRTVFWWDPVFRQYRLSNDRTVQIKPWQGYWVRALRPDVIMVPSPISQIGAAIGGQPIDDGGGGGPPAGP